MKRATALEEETSPPSGPPTLVKPSHELFGEILLRADRPKEAAEHSPWHWRVNLIARDLCLARLALRPVAETKSARAEFYAKFLRVWREADANLPELREARKLPEIRRIKLMRSMNQQTHTGLIRGIRRWDLVAVAINGIIGAGIFGLPSKVYALIGPYSLIAFTACALVVGLIVLCFAEVGSRFSETGGPYLYAREAFGPVVGFEVGWFIWLARFDGLFLGQLQPADRLFGLFPSGDRRRLAARGCDHRHRRRADDRQRRRRAQRGALQ